MNKAIFFRSALRNIPKNIDKQVEWSFGIADHLERALKEKGMSQKEFANKLGKTETEVSRWMCGTHNFTLSTLAKISSVLNEDMIKI